MRKKAVTLADIARVTGVSVNAVSLALRGKSGVSEEMRRRITRAADEMGYSMPGAGAGTILALIPQRFFTMDVNSVSFYHGLYFEMQRYSDSRGSKLILSSVPPEDEKALRAPPLIGSVPISGIVSVGNMSESYCRMLQGLGLPFVIADQYYDSVKASCVVTANASAAYALTSHLIELGHTDIQFIESPFRTSSTRDRWIGYMRAMLSHGLHPAENKLMNMKYVDHVSEEMIIETLDSLDTLPTAFVCGHDLIAQTVIAQMARRNLRCPEDFSVTGFDNIQSPDVLALNLTTCDTPKLAIAQTAIDLLLSAAQPPRIIQLYGEVIIRGSTGKN